MKNGDLKDLFGRAHAAGYAAGLRQTPRPMVVLYDSPGGRKTEVVDDGVCGFAWIVLRPGTSRAARWAVKHADFKKAYSGGVHRWVGDFNQSHERKWAYAEAYAAVLRTAGLNALADGRLA